MTESLRNDTAHRAVILLCHSQWEFQEYVTDGISALQELHPNLYYVAREPITDHLRKTLKTKLRGLSPRANYTDRAAAAGRRS